VIGTDPETDGRLIRGLSLAPRSEMTIGLGCKVVKRMP
jgi:hypothetical protein